MMSIGHRARRIRSKKIEVVHWMFQMFDMKKLMIIQLIKGAWKEGSLLFIDFMEEIIARNHFPAFGLIRSQWKIFLWSMKKLYLNLRKWICLSKSRNHLPKYDQTLALGHGSLETGLETFIPSSESSVTGCKTPTSCLGPWWLCAGLRHPYQGPQRPSPSTRLPHPRPLRPSSSSQHLGAGPQG